MLTIYDVQRATRNAPCNKVTTRQCKCTTEQQTTNGGAWNLEAKAAAAYENHKHSPTFAAMGMTLEQRICILIKYPKSQINHTASTSNSQTRSLFHLPLSRTHSPAHLLPLSVAYLGAFHVATPHTPKLFVSLPLFLFLATTYAFITHNALLFGCLF